MQRDGSFARTHVSPETLLYNYIQNETANKNIFKQKTVTVLAPARWQQPEVPGLQLPSAEEPLSLCAAERKYILEAIIGERERPNRAEVR